MLERLGQVTVLFHLLLHTLLTDFELYVHIFFKKKKIFYWNSPEFLGLEHQKKN